MRRLMIVVLLLVAASAFGQFRDTIWGMSPEELITSEEGQEPFYITRTPDDHRVVMFVHYKVEVFGAEVELSYEFDHICPESKGLVGASYFFPPVLYEQVESYLRREYERNGYYMGLSWWPDFRGPEVSILLESRPYSDSETFEVIYAAEWWLVDPYDCLYEFQD